MCECGNIGNTGGIYGPKRSGTSYIDLSQYDDAPYTEIRKYLNWGTCRSEAGDWLGTVRWETLKDMPLGTLERTINAKAGDTFHQVMFIKELQFRMLDMELI